MTTGKARGELWAGPGAGAGGRALALAAMLLAAAPAAAESLRDHVLGLSRQHGIELEGADRLGTEPASPARSRGLTADLDRLLANYNFVMLRDGRGRPLRLTIVGLRMDPPAAPASIPIQMDRDTAGHYVDAVVSGPSGRNVALRVMVDTGASTLVLPRSLAASLGFPESDLRRVWVQTANGATEGNMATLRSVRVGGVESENVAVTFVDDALLGGKQLLGMSFLGRFRVTIDSERGNVHLEKPQGQ